VISLITIKIKYNKNKIGDDLSNKVTKAFSKIKLKLIS